MAFSSRPIVVYWPPRLVTGQACLPRVGSCRTRQGGTQQVSGGEQKKGLQLPLLLLFRNAVSLQPRGMIFVYRINIRRFSICLAQKTMVERTYACRRFMGDAPKQLPAPPKSSHGSSWREVSLLYVPVSTLSERWAHCAIKCAPLFPCNHLLTLEKPPSKERPAVRRFGTLLHVGM